MNKQDIRVDSFECVDLRDIKLPIVAIYKSPKDYPGETVARLYDIDQPTNVILIKNDLEEIRKDITLHLSVFVRFDRGAGDDPCLVEVWVIPA